MANQEKVTVTDEWLDWYGKLMYSIGVRDEMLRRLHEDLERERQEQLARQGFLARAA